MLGTLGTLEILGFRGILGILTQFGTHAIQAALCNSKYTNAPCHPAPMGDLSPLPHFQKKRKNLRPLPLSPR